MNGKKVSLVALQVGGGLSILAAPPALIFAMCFWDAPNASRNPLYVIAVYPFVGVGLLIFSWRALSRGHSVLAFSLSSVPALCSIVIVGLAGWMVNDNRKGVESFKVEQAERYNKERREIEPVNPVLWAILCSHMCETPTPVGQVLRTIEANPTLVDTVVPGFEYYGTPLDLAVRTLRMDLGGAQSGDRDRIGVVRALVAHGAHLSGDRKNDLRERWRLKMTLNEEPDNTASENPLVWRIVTIDKDAFFSLHGDEIPLLNKSTNLYGTPLCAALLKRDLVNGSVLYYLFFELLNAGAHLSKEEERDPAVTASLKRAAADDPGMPWSTAGQASGDRVRR